MRGPEKYTCGDLRDTHIYPSKKNISGDLGGFEGV